MSREGLREESPLPLAEGRVEMSPTVGMSDCQNNSISQNVISMGEFECKMWVRGSNSFWNHF